MPWKVSSVMDERVRFVARVLEGEAMSDVSSPHADAYACTARKPISLPSWPAKGSE